MRDIISKKHPGIVSLNDQSHVANPALTDLLKTPFGKRVLTKAASINVFIINHQHVLAYYCKLMKSYKAGLKAAAESSSGAPQEALEFLDILSDLAQLGLDDVDDDDDEEAGEEDGTEAAATAEVATTAINFIHLCHTRMCCKLDVLERCDRNRKVLADLVYDESKIRSLVGSASTARAAREEFISNDEDKQQWIDIKSLIVIATPMRVYLRRFDKDSVDLTTVYPETLKMCDTYGELFRKLKGDSNSSCSFLEVNLMAAALERRVHGPTNRSVKVLLLQPIHYLAAAVNPLTSQSEFSKLFAPGTSAFKRFMANSPTFFSEAILNESSEEDRCKTFGKELMEFVSNTSPPFVAGKMIYSEGCDLAGFWLTFGSDTPLLAQVGRWISHLSASFCPAERSFSTQRAIQTKTRNRLLANRVRKLMFVRWNLRLLAGLSPEVADAMEKLAAEIDVAISDAQESMEVEEVEDGNEN
eukprot:Plantae.Rhodophyta-Palmaria_palmata.ctg6783.p1 GENE.Plantae.Rhodophyta-Palmaria_palmata.ctg6783~~Plantae.Rhodophyta-Palmaria_palmata.ctg6783.p1  ORF type:complete len:494 (-),score=98.26 Plantae.Rhodophyta-Palmaria_palmata.ctg6783:161-1576(-)